MISGSETRRELGSVSVVIPAFNCAGTIGAAVESCLLQSYPPLEVIVVNDGSADATGSVLSGFGDRIKVIDQANAGLAGARNAGTRAARGDYVAWMDADDISVPDRFLVQASVLEAYPLVGLVSSDFSAFRDPVGELERSHIDTYYSAPARLGGLDEAYSQDATLAHITDQQEPPPPIRRGKVYESLLWGNFVHPPTVMARRSLHEAAGSFDESLRYSSDYDLILRMARLTEFGYVKASLLRYRLSVAQMSNAAGQGKLQLETARILRGLETVDPELHASKREFIRRRIAEALLSAASAVGSSDRVRAFSLLRDGLRHGFIPVMALRATARILLPIPMLKVVSATRRRLAARSRLA